jgi:hypothetical protein
VFNILSHKGNANQNNFEIPSHTNQNGYHQENNTTSAGKDGGVKGPLHTVGRNVN